MELVFNWTVRTSFAHNLENRKENAMNLIVMVTSASTGRVIRTISVQNLSAQNMHLRLNPKITSNVRNSNAKMIQIVQINVRNISLKERA